MQEDEEAQNGDDDLEDKPSMAACLDIGVRTLDEWMRLRRIPYLKIGRTVRFRRKDVMEHLAKYRIN